MPKSHHRPKQPKAGLRINRRRDQLVSYALEAVERTAALTAPTPVEMLLAAMPLRALLVEGGQGYLNQSAQSHGFVLDVPFSPSAFLMSHFPRNSIKVGVTGGCEVWGKIIGGILFADQNVYVDPNVILKDSGNVKDFTDQTVIIINGDVATRGHVIKYVANKVGFAHLEQDRSENEYVVLDKARSVFGFNEAGSNMHLNLNELDRIPDPLTAFEARVDAVMFQIYVTCVYLMKTRRLKDLMEILK